MYICLAVLVANVAEEEIVVDEEAGSVSACVTLSGATLARAVTVDVLTAPVTAQGTAMCIILYM